MKYLKTLLTSISSAALLLAFPIVTFAAYTAGWTGTSTGTNFIFPTLINGIQQTVQANNFLGTSTTAASNFTLLGVGSSTPFGNLGVVGTTTIKGNLLVTRTGEVPTYNDSNLSLMDIVDNVNSYTFIGLQNKNNGVSASSDFVWGNNRTTAATYYFDCGVASSNYADPIYSLFAPNDGYCFVTDGGLNLGTGTTTAAGVVKFFTGGYAPANEKARITQAGNFGIGTTSPFATLAVNPVAGAASNQFVVGSSTGTQFIINNNGNVGVGTAVPTKVLDVSGQSRFRDILTVDGGSQITWGTLNNVLYGGIFNTIGSTALGFGTNGTTPDLMINSSGDIGIGTTTPGTRLSVFGTITSSSTPPVISSCGTSPTVVGNNNYGEVTTGATATGCTITFATAYPVFASCTVTNQSMSVVNAMTYTVSKSAIVVSQTGLGGAKINYKCDGY